MADSYRSPDGTFERIRKSVLEDYKLTGDEAQMINYAAAKPEGWVFYETKVAEETGWTRHKVRMAFRGLRKHGYFVVGQDRDAKGKIVGSVTRLDYDKVIAPDKPRSEPGGGNPSAGSDLHVLDVLPGQIQEDGKPPGGETPTSDYSATSDYPSSDYSEDQNPCTPGPAEPAGAGAANDQTPGDWRQEKLTCWTTAAYLACGFQVITGSEENRQAESRTVRWLVTTYRPLPDGTLRTPLQFTVFLVKVFRAARLPIDALTGMKAEGELDTTSSADGAAELLTLVRKADKEALAPAEYAAYERLTGTAAREALWCLTTSEAITAGISLPEQPREDQ